MSISLTLIVTSFVVYTIFVHDLRINRIIINVLAIILLIWKISEFTYYGVSDKKIYPVEFSHISYFIVSILILTQYKKLYFTAGIFAFISGIGYLIPALISPYNMVNAHSVAIVIMGVVSHMTLLFLGITLLFNYTKYNLKDLYIPFIFIALSIGYIELINYQIIFPDLGSPSAYISINLLNGNLLNKYFGITNKVYGWLTSAGAIIVASGLIILIQYLNNIIFIHKKNKSAN